MKTMSIVIAQYVHLCDMIVLARLKWVSIVEIKVIPIEIYNMMEIDPVLSIPLESLYQKLLNNNAIFHYLIYLIKIIGSKYSKR